MELLEEYITSSTNQARLLATVWRDEKFYFLVKQVGLQGSDFAMPSCETVFKILMNYREKYGKMPSMATLQDLVASKLKENEDTGETTLKEMCWVLGILSGDTILDYNYASDQVINFIKTARISRAAADPNDAARIEKAVKEVEFLARKKPQVSPLKDFRELLPQTSAETDVKIPTGIPFLDFVTGGGLNASLNEIGLGMAGTGVGKTNMMINFTISAAFAGFRVLFITLELTDKEISRRLFAMAAHIRTKEIKLPWEQWSPESQERLEYLARSKISDYIRIADMSDRNYAVSDLTGEIETWKRETKALTGSDESCKLVIIDWLDMLVPEARDAKMVQQPWQALEKVGKDLKHMVNNQNVALWCVSQTNRSGSGVQKVRLDHISGAYSKNYFGSIVLGLAPAEEADENKEINQNISEAEMQKLNIECNRDLHLSILKNRDGVQRESDIYQGPTLRFWQSKSAWRTTEKMLAGRDMKKIFGDGLE